MRYNNSITIRLPWNWQCPLQSRERLEGTAGLGVCAVKPAHNASRRAMFESRSTGKELWVWRRLTTSLPGLPGAELCQAAQQGVSQLSPVSRNARLNLAQKRAEEKRLWGFLERPPTLCQQAPSAGPAYTPQNLSAGRSPGSSSSSAGGWV